MYLKSAFYSKSQYKKSCKMDFEMLRFYVKTRWLLKENATKIFNDLKVAYGDQAPSYDFVAKWIRLFIDGRENIKDEPRSGRPPTALTEANIKLVRDLIEDNPFMTYNEIEAQTSLFPQTINSILHDHLHVRKIVSRFVPYDLSPKNKEERVRICKENLAKIREGKVRLCDIITGDESWFYYRQIGHKQSNASWVYEGESPRTLVRRGRFEPKTMFSIFFRTTGLVHISYMEGGQSIDAGTYIERCLKPMFKIIMKQRPSAGLANIRLHHDNARPHVASDVKAFLKDVHVPVFEHPAYSPDLAPSDFWLFDYLKKRLSDHDEPEGMKREITKIMKNSPSSEYKKTFNKWVERMEQCIMHNGEYFEHLTT